MRGCARVLCARVRELAGRRRPQTAPTMVRLLGLMGPIASGKSAVAARLRSSDCPVVDADQISHELQSDPRGSVGRRLVAEFGSEIVGADGRIDRASLGEIVFGDPSKLRALNKATHSPILQEMLRQTVVLMLKGHRQIALDIPLLAKFLVTSPRLLRLVLSGVVAVVVPPDVQLARLMSRNKLPEEEAKRRIETQMSGEKQRELADWVIENDGTLEDLEGRVAAFLRKQPHGRTMWEVVVLFSLALGGAVATAMVAGPFAGTGVLVGGSFIAAKL